MHAVSEDLKHWTKTQDAVTFVPQPGYDPDDWRDPFVLWDDESEKYILILGARLEGDKHKTTGRTVYFTSDDLADWEFQGISGHRICLRCMRCRIFSRWETGGI